MRNMRQDKPREMAVLSYLSSAQFIWWRNGMYNTQALDFIAFHAFSKTHLHQIYTNYEKDTTMN